MLLLVRERATGSVYNSLFRGRCLMVRRARMILACFLPLLVSSQAGPAQEEKRDPEDRLLKAELLEVSTGDLEKAMAVYKEIQGDEKAPASARARAMLYLGRCHRKRGEIDAAKKTLDDLVKSYASEREVVRQAQGFLRELQGRPENPNFDWLKELEKSPEIQARVFELAMDLVDPGTEAGRRAQRQLIALGTIAVPVLERVIETSRDPRQRQYLALMLLYAGRYE